MANPLLTLDEFHFEKQYRLFKRFVETTSGLPLASLSSNPYTEEQEGYKYEVHRNARKALDFGAWRRSDVGSGRIAAAIIAAIELPENNLVQWQPRYGLERRPHHPLYMARTEQENLVRYEQALYDLFRDEVSGEQAFRSLVELFGAKYSFLAYLFFLKDRTRYMPIAPQYFDTAFKKLGVSFTTSKQCSWENYSQYNSLLSEIQMRLSNRLDGDVSLLDAHSFAWMLASKIEDTEVELELQKYDHLPLKEREAIVKARIGQGRFRQQLLDYWETCAVTGCEENSLLVASHTKPWSECDVREAIDPYNGLLLSPNLDAAFDNGYVSFTDTGEVLISRALRAKDAAVLGIETKMRLRRIEGRHLPYLRYHRESRLRKS